VVQIRQLDGSSANLTAAMTQQTVRRLAGRAVPIADQLAWSAANVVMVVAAARLLSAADFGAFAAALLIIVIALTTARSFVTEPLLLRHPGPEGQLAVQLRSDGAVIGGSLVLAPALAVGALTLFAVFEPGRPIAVFAALAAACVANVAQDSVRFVALATGRPVRALLSDLCWFACSVAYLAFVWGGGEGGVAQALMMWSVGAAVAFVAGLGLLGTRPRLRSGIGWVRSSRVFGSRLAADALAGVAAANVAFLALGAIAGPEALAGLRGAYLLLGPLNAVTEGVYLAVVPALAIRTAGGRSIGHHVVRMGAALTLVWVVYSVIVLVVPGAWKQALLGDTWAFAEPVLPWLLLASVFGAIGIAAVYGVRAWRSGRALIRIRLAMLPLYLVILPLASWWNGATGFAIALVGVSLVQIGLYGSAFVRIDGGIRRARTHPDSCGHQGEPDDRVPVEDLIGDEERE
jgi:O-antigen/teichoic acid export membrane protein